MEQECGAEQDDWVCTLEPDHGGDLHKALNDEGEVLADWPVEVKE